MKIGIDIDGVILDTERPLRFYADFWSTFVLGKERLKSTEVSQELNFDWNTDEINEFYAKYFDDITKNSHIVVGAKEILKKLKDEGHELFIVTLRGFYREEEKILATEKLNQLGIDFEGIYWSVKNKRQKCEELGLDVIIDDSPSNASQFEGSKIKVLYFKEPPVRDVDFSNVTKVNCWMDIYREINKL